MAQVASDTNAALAQCCIDEFKLKEHKVELKHALARLRASVDACEASFEQATAAIGETDDRKRVWTYARVLLRTLLTVRRLYCEV